MRTKWGYVAAGTAAATLAAALYGVVNDQITVTISPPYYTAFKAVQFEPLLAAFGAVGAPARVIALLVGVAATWWMGAILGLVLSLFCALGRRPTLARRHFAGLLLGVLWRTLVCAAALGMVQYALPFDIANETDRCFAMVGAWHNGAYFGAAVCTVRACYKAWKLRCAVAAANPEEAACAGSA